MGKWKRCWPHKWVKSVRYNAFSTFFVWEGAHILLIHS